MAEMKYNQTLEQNRFFVNRLNYFDAVYESNKKCTACIYHNKRNVTEFRQQLNNYLKQFNLRIYINKNYTFSVCDLGQRLYNCAYINFTCYGFQLTLTQKEMCKKEIKILIELTASDWLF